MLSYRTFSAVSRTKIAVGACRFFASLAPCCTEEEAKAFIGQVKKELPGATHHAYAYRLGFGDGIIARCSDDGEPALTAGQPMLGVLEREGLSDVVLVGTRYFGGVKLGVGGLIRAYRSCALAGVKDAIICEKESLSTCKISVPYDYLGGVLKEIEANEGKVLRFQYLNDVQLNVSFPEEKKAALLKMVGEASRGTATIN